MMAMPMRKNVGSFTTNPSDERNRSRASPNSIPLTTLWGTHFSMTAKNRP
jgi:hypothetical protein